MHYTEQTDLETCLQLIDDPKERARLIEEAFRLVVERELQPADAHRVPRRYQTVK